jgi:hypothetical protein
MLPPAEVNVAESLGIQLCAVVPEEVSVTREALTRVAEARAVEAHIVRIGG